MVCNYLVVFIVLKVRFKKCIHAVFYYTMPRDQVSVVSIRFFVVKHDHLLLDSKVIEVIMARVYRSSDTTAEYKLSRCMF